VETKETCNRGSLNGMLKQLYLLTEKLVPDRVFVRLFPRAFAAYRFVLRLSYLRFILKYTLQGERPKLQRAKHVFRVMPYSLVGWRGLEATYDAALDVESRGLDGAFVECGVAKGGSAALMAMVAAGSGSSRKVWLFDSFQGLPPPTEDDYEGESNSTGTHIGRLAEGACLGTYEEVEDLMFNKLHLSRSDVSLVEGWFEDTIPRMAEEARPIAILRIDADWHDSVRTCLDHLFDNVVPTGYVIIDDYGTCFGAKKAVDQFIAERNLDLLLVPDGRGGMLFKKPA